MPGHFTAGNAHAIPRAAALGSGGRPVGEIGVFAVTRSVTEQQCSSSGASMLVGALQSMSASPCSGRGAHVSARPRDSLGAAIAGRRPCGRGGCHQRSRAGDPSLSEPPSCAAPHVVVAKAYRLGRARRTMSAGAGGASIACARSREASAAAAESSSGRTGEVVTG